MAACSYMKDEKATWYRLESELDRKCGYFQGWPNPNWYTCDYTECGGPMACTGSEGCKLTCYDKNNNKIVRKFPGLENQLSPLNGCDDNTVIRYNNCADHPCDYPSGKMRFVDKSGANFTPPAQDLLSGHLDIVCDCKGCDCDYCSHCDDCDDCGSCDERELICDCEVSWVEEFTPPVTTKIPGSGASSSNQLGSCGVVTTPKTTTTTTTTTTPKPPVTEKQTPTKQPTITKGPEKKPDDIPMPDIKQQAPVDKPKLYSKPIGSGTDSSSNVTGKVAIVGVFFLLLLAVVLLVMYVIRTRDRKSPPTRRRRRRNITTVTAGTPPAVQEANFDLVLPSYEMVVTGAAPLYNNEQFATKNFDETSLPGYESIYQNADSPPAYRSQDTCSVVNQNDGDTGENTESQSTNHRPPDQSSDSHTVPSHTEC